MAKKARRASKARKARQAAKSRKSLKAKSRQRAQNQKRTDKPDWADRYRAWRKHEDIRNREEYASAAERLGISIDSYLERFVNARYKRPEPTGIGRKGLN
jgi:hypothetical protein